MRVRRLEDENLHLVYIRFLGVGQHIARRVSTAMQPDNQNVEY